MKLIRQILSEAGADISKAITIVPSFGGYFQSVKRVEEYTPQKIVLSVAKNRIVIVGDKLNIDKYFMQDLFIKGSISGVTIE